MSRKLARFEKYSVAPSPSRDYYGIKVLDDQVILYLWKVTHGPHLSPTIKVTKFSDFDKDNSLRDEILFAFGPHILKFIDGLTSNENSFLNLPKSVTQKLVRYLSFKDVAKLSCLSRLSYETYNSNAIWEILYKRMKGVARLTEMEKDLGTSQGFKKLAKNHHMRALGKRNIKFANDKPSLRLQKTSNLASDKILRSSSVNLSSDEKKIPRKQSVDGNMKSLGRPKLSSRALQAGKKLDNPDVVEKPGVFMENQNLGAKMGAGECYQHPLIINEGHSKSKQKEVKIRAEDKEKEEEEALDAQKKLLKSMILESEITDGNTDESIKKKALTIKSARSIFTKHSAAATLGELKSKASDKAADKKKPKLAKDKASRLPLKNLTSEEKNEDSDGSGMSYLMKRYLEASDEVEKKLANCERLANTTRDSSTQADINARKPERKVPRKAAKQTSMQLDRPLSRSVKGIVDQFPKSKSLKKY